MSSSPCPQCGKPVLWGAPVCRWCKAKLGEPSGPRAPLQSVGPHWTQQEPESGNLAKPVAVRNDFLALPEFWAALYYHRLGSDEADPEEFWEPFFGMTATVVNDFYDRELSAKSDNKERPRIEIPLVQGFSFRVEFIGDPDDETRFIINHSSWDVPTVLGHEGGHFALPAFRWSEIKAIRTSLGKKEGAVALLLALPGTELTEGDEETEVKSILQAAWKELGFVRPQSIGGLVQQVVEHSRSDVHWRLDQR